jgi:hypothetical protein
MEQLETFGPLMFNTTKPSDNGPSKFGASVRSGTANPCVLEPTGTKEADGARAKRGAAARPARDAAPDGITVSPATTPPPPGAKSARRETASG